MTNIVTQGVHIEITPAMYNHVQEQFSYLLEHFESLIVKNIEVNLDVDSKHTKKISFVKATIPLKGNVIFVEEKGSDMYSVISKAVEKATKQLSVIKNKHNKKHFKSQKRNYHLMEETE